MCPDCKPTVTSPERGALSDAAVVQRPVAGSNRSTDANSVKLPPGTKGVPPATRICPSGSSAIAAPLRAWLGGVVSVQRSVAGS
jgi:hypothetical protein